MALTRYQRPGMGVMTPFEQLSQLREEVSRFFQGTPAERARSTFFTTWAPSLDLLEDKDNLYVRLEVPGMRKEDISVTLQNNTLSLAGERKAEVKDAQSHRTERVEGRFQRSVVLPVKVNPNGIKASYKNGILMVTLPKAAESKPRQIEVQVS